MYPPNLQDIYSLMGFTLAYSQLVEANMRLVTTYVLQGDGELTLLKLQAVNATERKKTLGYFVKKVKERGQLHPDLETLLDGYLDQRNDFIHNQHRIPGWSLETEAGVAAAKEYTTSLLWKAHKINEIFLALVLSWQNQIGLSMPAHLQEHPFFRNIEAKYSPLINELFGAAET